MQHGIELSVCTAHMKNKSDVEHAQLTRGPDYAIVFCQISFPLLPSPPSSPYFLSLNCQNEIWGRDKKNLQFFALALIINKSFL